MECHLQTLQAANNDDRPYAQNSDDSYHELIANKLQSVPAINLYDGEYVSRLNEYESRADSEIAALKAEIARMEAELAANQSMAAMGGITVEPTFPASMYEAELASLQSDLSSTATEIQTYLHESTSDIDAAKLWDAKFVKAANEHIPPHYKKNMGDYDAVMSETMEAFRNWASFAQYQIDMFGSQNLINAVYEAVQDGQSAMEYMQVIMDLNAESGGNEENLNENANITVPNAGFFGGSFFF